MNKLYSEIEKLNDRYKDSSYVDVNKELYQLTEDVGVKFLYWYDGITNDECDTIVADCPENRNKQLFTYFIENIYKKEK